MKRISYSKINTFITCPLRYQFQYIEKLERPDSSSTQQLGKYIHEVLEHWREGLDLTEVGTLFEDKYLLADEEKSVVPMLLANAKAMYEPYRGMPAESELRLEYATTNQGEEIVINGIIDKVYHASEDKFIIVDYKTGRSRMDNSLQMKFYFYLLNKARGYKPEDITAKIFYLRLNQTVTYNFDTATLREFETWLWTVLEFIDKTEKFVHDFSKACSFCQYRKEDCVPYKIKKEKYGV